MSRSYLTVPVALAIGVLVRRSVCSFFSSPDVNATNVRNSEDRPAPTATVRAQPTASSLPTSNAAHPTRPLASDSVSGSECRATGRWRSPRHEIAFPERQVLVRGNDEPLGDGAGDLRGVRQVRRSRDLEHREARRSLPALTCDLVRSLSAPLQ